MATELHRKQLKEDTLAAVASWYNPWAHLAGTTGVGVAVLVLALWNLHDVRWIELLTIPAVFLFANAFEWRVHKYVLHRKFPVLVELYRKHTPSHHGIYVTEDMEIQSAKEFRLVLIPAIGVLSIVVATGPLAYALGRFVSPNTGWLFLITSGLYMVSYEITHLTYHLPKDSLIGRQKIIRILREHHARHHDPKLMQDWNFNVTIPLFDWLLGTTWKPRP
jgi:hypothetical protein